ncbi:MAG: hypothetical protein KatS3mg013_1249 [Actinomycetota bacterium]|nr:MAG: hypothetical protein KatS3mg013_1249 [Actinomycetota bacterium]
MGIATVTLVGAGSLGRAEAFLRLGAVVVVAPDREALAAWLLEHLADRAPEPDPGGGRDDEGLAVDHRSHVIRWRGTPLRLTELEFRVLACLASEPGRAWSYRELRESGWGPGPDLGDDPYVVRALVQRVRRKLRAVGAEVRIEPVRGFGLRLEGPGVAPPLRLARPAS